MKTTFVTMMVLALATLVGCGSPQGGGISADEGFKIDKPFFTVQIKQGETESVKVTLNRGKYFKQDVALEIKASKGISVEPTTKLVRGNEKPDVSLRITAAKDADLGEYMIFVKATPETGESTETEIAVKVVAP